MFQKLTFLIVILFFLASCGIGPQLYDDVYYSPDYIDFTSDSNWRDNIILYDGRPRPLNEIAIISKGSQFAFASASPVESGVKVLAGHGAVKIIPGNALFSMSVKNPGTEKYQKIDYKRSAEVLPGEAYVGITIEYIGVGRELRGDEIIFYAEAGHTYIVESLSGSAPGAWIIDENTNEIMGKIGNFPNEIFEMK